MKLLIFGASGTVGTEIVKQALEKGHRVAAFVRHPENFTVKSPNLNLVKGDALNKADVEAAVKNQDVILCAIGDGKVGKIRGIGTKNIVAAMQKSGIKRLICQSTIGAGDSYGNLNFVWKYIMFGFLLKRVLPDHEMQEKHIEESGLDYTIVRPGALTNGAVTQTTKPVLMATTKN